MPRFSSIFLLFFVNQTQKHKHKLISSKNKNTNTNPTTDLPCQLWGPIDPKVTIQVERLGLWPNNPVRG